MPGDFTSSVWPEAQARALDLFEDPRFARRYRRPSETASAIISNHSARWREITDNGRCIGFKAMWLKDTDFAVTQDADLDAFGCEINGGDIDSDSTIYSPNIGFYKEYKVTDHDCDNQYTYAQKFAEQLLMNKVKMDEELNRQLIAFVDGAAEGTQYANGLATVVGNSSQIPAAEWNEDLMGEFSLHAQYNDIVDNAFFLSANNFFTKQWNANFEALNANERDRIAKYGAFGNWYFDVRNIISEVGAGLTYMIDPGAYGFFDQVGVPSLEPVPLNDKDNTLQMMVESDQLVKPDGSAVRYGVTVRHYCVRKPGQNTLTRETRIRLTFHGGVYQSPTEYGIHSGVLKFEKV